MNFDITVSREELDLALKQVKKFNKGKKPFDLVIRLGYLEFGGFDISGVVVHGLTPFTFLAIKDLH